VVELCLLEVHHLADVAVWHARAEQGLLRVRPVEQPSQKQDSEVLLQHQSGFLHNRSKRSGREGVTLVGCGSTTNNVRCSFKHNASTSDK
jgi:hypothetical protein